MSRFVELTKGPEFESFSFVLFSFLSFRRNGLTWFSFSVLYAHSFYPRKYIFRFFYSRLFIVVFFLLLVSKYISSIFQYFLLLFLHFHFLRNINSQIDESLTNSIQLKTTDFRFHCNQRKGKLNVNNLEMTDVKQRNGKISGKMGNSGRKHKVTFHSFIYI